MCGLANTLDHIYTEKKFTIYTDHKPFTWLMSLKDPNSRLTRRRLRLAEYDFEIKYKQGAINSNADALSRVKINCLDNESILPQIGSDCNEQVDMEIDCQDSLTQHSQDDNVHPGIPILQDVIKNHTKFILNYIIS